MDNTNVLFSLDEMKSINSTIYHLYNDKFSLSGCIDFFINELRHQIYFDKMDFTFFNYNDDTNLYEMQLFVPANWKDAEAEHYINTYIHMDDVLPILSTPQEVAFRNNDIFSAERKETTYYKEFIKTAQLEISIDANIVLSPSCKVFAIMGVYRNSGRNEFSLKDLEIVRIYQKHLSKVFEKHLSNNDSDDLEDDYHEFDNFESLGICLLDSSLEFISFNTPFKNFIADCTTPIQYSEMGLMVKGFAEKLSNDAAEKNIGPSPVEVGGMTFLVEVSRYYQNHTKYICIVHPLYDSFFNKINTIKNTYRLSAREFEILYLMLKNGMTNEEISEKLFISPATVKRHISNAYIKLGISNLKQLLGLINIA